MPATKRAVLPVLHPTTPEGPFCGGCTYQPTGVRRVLPDGGGTNGVMLVGDSPYTEEVAAGRPFVGPSGRYLDGILTKRGLSRDDFLVSNSLWCKPPHLGMNDNPERYPEAQMAIRQCRPYLDELIKERKPKVLVALGNVALKRLTGFSDIEVNHSYVFQSEHGVPVVPTFHPSGLIQGNHNLTIAFILGIARALEIANGTFKPTPVNIVEDPDPAYLQYGGRGADLPTPLMCDIETPKSLAGRNEEEAEDDPSYTIVRMGFSVASWNGVSFPFEGDYIRRAKELIRRAKTLIFWNKNYDLPRLKANGFTLHPDCTIVDAMWAWHWLYSDLPKALAFAAPFIYCGPAWKHLASQRPGYYNGMDNAIQMGVYEGVKKQLIADNRWDRFWSHCVRVDPIYVRMGEKGVKVDKVARTTFMAALEKEALAELVKVQELVPAAYKERFPDKVMQESFKELKLPKVSSKVTKRMYQSLIRVEKVEVPAIHKDGSVVLTATGEPLLRPLWRRTIPFNPGSRPDMLRLMHVLGVKPPKARGEDRESVEAKYLKRLTKYPIFRYVVLYKQRCKLLSTYNWTLHDVELTTIEGIRLYVKKESSKGQVMVGDEGKRVGAATSTAIEARSCTEEEAKRWATTSLLSIDKGAEASKTLPSRDERGVFSQEANRLSDTKLWGSWVGPTPSSRELSSMPSIIHGREALHPSFGLGQIKQQSQQLHGSMCFVPCSLPQKVTDLGSILLPVTRTCTSSDRATSTYGFHPSTWRSSSRNVNLGNIPKRFELAKLYRHLLIAEHGHKLIEIDRSAIEAVLVGHWAKSPAYINLAKAGVHSYLGSYILGRPIPLDLPFKELKLALKEVKKAASVEAYESWKRCIHATNYLISAYGLHDEYEELYETEYAAQKTQDMYLNTPAGQAVRAWHKATIEEAYAKKYLDNSFQYRHYFFGPMYKFNKREKRWGVDHEGDAKRAVAFRPQSDAAAIQRNDLLELDQEAGWITSLLRLPTYDSLVVEAPDNLVDKAIEALARQFNKPIPELGGLTIGFEIKVGNSLGDMSEVSL